MAGAGLSLWFGVETQRKSDALGQQTIQLLDQTRAAQKYAQRADNKEKEATRAKLAGLLIPIDSNPQMPFALADSLGAAEAEALRQLRGTTAPARLQFLEIALDDSQTARPVGRRASWVVQAIVGCDRSMRYDVGRLLVRRVREPGTPQEVKLACARPRVRSARRWALSMYT